MTKLYGLTLYSLQASVQITLQSALLYIGLCLTQCKIIVAANPWLLGRPDNVEQQSSKPFHNQISIGIVTKNVNEVAKNLHEGG